jgi:hypothetical protein
MPREEGGTKLMREREITRYNIFKDIRVVPS